MKHVTVRFAWHDNKWNGRICMNPTGNFYCRDNYSLISPRIQKRINLGIEDKLKERPVSDALKSANYIPPCYWSINALGEKDYPITDPHPFQDLKRMGEKFSKQVPPLKSILRHNSVFTWCFKLGFGEDRSEQLYVPTSELKKRVDVYTGEISKEKSIAFFYANYSNPLTGDDYRYVLLGAGLVEGLEKPIEYSIPQSLLQELRSGDRMQNFPTSSWQFQINLKPETTFIMPYHEYLRWTEDAQGAQRSERWKKLEEIVIPINEGNVIPHFKYVSMHVNHDKAIFLLYLFKRSLRKMKEHGEIVPYSEVEKIEFVVDRLLNIAWKERGKYPGFENSLYSILKTNFAPEKLKDTISAVRSFILKKTGSLDKFFSSTTRLTAEEPAIAKALREIEVNKELLRFLSIFDFSTIQFNNVKEIINKIGFQTIKKNPYLLLEKYHFDGQDSWNIEEADYGINLYQIDIALIPDLDYADWETPYSAQSPERIRAVITKILYDVTREGSSCLTREEIIESIKNYPLFYIADELNVDVDKLIEYEKQPIFKEKFVIRDESFQGGPVLYQLKQLRTVEDALEQFFKKMMNKKHTLSSSDQSWIDNTVRLEKQGAGDKLNSNERQMLYRNALENGLFILSGKAGSGKTTAVVNLIQRFRELDNTPIFVFTPTGKANIVIRDRLKPHGLTDDNRIKISTIHRFLYSAIFDAIRNYQTQNKYSSYNRYNEYRPNSNIGQQASIMVDLISKILSGKLEVLDDFMELSKGFRFSPQVVIIDEASMIDEVLLSALFAMINADNLKHLIVVGDEKQLPPIGAGRPFVDTIFQLKRTGMERNYIRLESNLRFDTTARIGYLAEIFGGNKSPHPHEIADALAKNDSTLEIHYFSSDQELKESVRKVLNSIGKPKAGALSDMFGDIFEDSTKPVLDRIQIITPRRVGSFGSLFINTNVVKEGVQEFSPRTKLICEENKYVYVKKDGRYKRVLALANGSMGYIMPDGSVRFEDLDDFQRDFGWSYDIENIKREVRDDYIGIERTINFGYAITVHKAQGSDYEHVILVIPEMSPFIMRELLYTAFTRIRTKLHLMIHSSLKDELALIFAKAYENSSVEQRRTLLFGHKSSPYRPYLLTLKNGTTIEVRNKIEQIIGRTLDNFCERLEYEPKDFLQEHRVLPDFKFEIDGITYYLEHLGHMDNRSYRNRWIQKLGIYEKLGIGDNLITTTESDQASDTEQNIFQIVSDVKANSLKVTPGSHSKHHYVI